MANHYATALNATPSYGERFGKKLFMLAVLAIPLGFLIAGVITYVMPRKYESRAVLQVKPSLRSEGVLGEDGFFQSELTPQFFATQFEIMRSQKTLSLVSEKLNLANRWNMSKEDTIQQLTGIVTVQNIRESDLIGINVMHSDPEAARDIAREVYEVYKTQREQAELVLTESACKQLERAVLEQQNVVGKQAQLLMKNKPTPADVTEVTDTELRSQLQKNLDRLIQAKNDDERMLLAGTMLEGDNPVKAIYQEYLKAGEELDALRKKKIAEDEPAMLAKQVNIQMISDRLQGSLKEYLKLLQAQLGVDSQLTDLNKNNEDLYLSGKDYEAVKADYEEQSKLLDEMKEKLITDQINAKQPQNIVELHEEPVIARAPSSPKTNLMLLLGGVGLPLAVLLLGLPLTAFIHLVSRR